MFWFGAGARKSRSFRVLTVVMLVALLFLGGCGAPYDGGEPPFKVSGPSAVLARAIVNVEVIKSDGTGKMTTLLYNGATFAVDNADAAYYRIYISYDNNVMAWFYAGAARDRYRGVPANELLFHKADDLIVVSFIRSSQRRLRGMQKAFMVPLAELTSVNGFYGAPATHAEKFSAFYE